MGLILNIESATEICSVALSQSGRIIGFAEDTEPYRHSERLTILIQKCIQSAACKLDDIDAVALSKGPGSYTSLRVGASVAKGICYALDKPLIAIDTLESLALAASKTRRTGPDKLMYCPMIDARRMEVYLALFDRQVEPVTVPRALIIDEHSFAAEFEAGFEIIFCGNGAAKCKNIIAHPRAVFKDIVCSAKHLIPIADRLFHNTQFSDFSSFEPFYLKQPNITRPKKIL